MSSNKYKQVLVTTGSYHLAMNKQGFHKGFSNKH